MVLQVEETSGPLNVGQRLWSCHLLPLEYLTRRDRPLELAHELLEVMLHHPIEAHDIAVQVVQHLSLSRNWTQKIQRCTTGEGLDIAFMGREERDETVGKAPLSAHPWENRTGHIASLYCMDKQVLGSARFVHEAGAWAGLAG